jgi:hypothetical protein
MLKIRIDDVRGKKAKAGNWGRSYSVRQPTQRRGDNQCMICTTKAAWHQ